MFGHKQEYWEKNHNDVATLKNKSSRSKKSRVSLQHFVVICKI